MQRVAIVDSATELEPGTTVQLPTIPLTDVTTWTTFLANVRLALALPEDAHIKRVFFKIESGGKTLYELEVRDGDTLAFARRVRVQFMFVDVEGDE